MNKMNKLIDEYRRSGNEEVFKEILKISKGTINKIINMYSNTNDEDIRQEAYVGLIKAINTYEEGWNCKFNTYAYTCIRNEVSKYYNKEKNSKRIGKYQIDRLDKPILIEEKKATQGDLVASKTNIEEYLLFKESKDRLNKCIKEYSEKHSDKWETIELVLNGNNYRDVGELVGVSRTTVGNWYKQFIEYCKIHYEISNKSKI